MDSIRLRWAFELEFTLLCSELLFCANLRPSETKSGTELLAVERTLLERTSPERALKLLFAGPVFFPL